MMDRKLFAARLGEVRQKRALELGRKLTQAEVSDAAGVSRSHLAGAESQHTGISLDAAVALSQYYNVSLDYLTGLSGASSQGYENAAHDEREVLLLKIWRAMSDEERLGLMALLKARIDTNAA
ncbi:helix-turn-helix domain-containing protein [Komagataeibacter intermedius]|uniref:Transcriptional regulator n=1 Tax=Komagataeibacter intermedius NRIC 0521 TaxID=1307934 RepID=A0ABQ0PHI7_9PROT|nr:helix-turn-helix transcriptional regulator [Komagataeibacter intermedius]GAN86382.1 transcriptional regulator XRE [Komagataeibacter intermedius TF2]GBQ68050.1 putative transcriptional regulator [Komagataeibacter intermedius NRIC 0521]